MMESSGSCSGSPITPGPMRRSGFPGNATAGARTDVPRPDKTIDNGKATAHESTRGVCAAIGLPDTLIRAGRGAEAGLHPGARVERWFQYQNAAAAGRSRWN